MLLSFNFAELPALPENQPSQQEMLAVSTAISIHAYFASLNYSRVAAQAAIKT